MLDDIELVPVPSRETVLADLEVLATDFGRLFATDCECHCRTDRDYWPSRFVNPTAKEMPKCLGGDDADEWNHYVAGDGVSVEPTGSKTPEDYDRGPVFYDRSGRPIVNSLGQSLVVSPGWMDWHTIKLRGPGSLRATETIERANHLSMDGMGYLMPFLWPGRSMAIRSFCWPSVVDRVAELANRSTLKPNTWLVMAGGQSYSLSVWRRRVDFDLGGPMVAPEVAERIGDEPESVWAMRESFLGDSELAARWLIGVLAELAGDEIEADDQGDQAGDRDAIGSAALRAVVDGNLAGVLHAAVGTRATDRVTAVMRQRIANDRTLYGWTQRDWADDLGVSTKTISKCDAWREILDWRASNEVNRVSKETGK